MNHPRLGRLLAGMEHGGSQALVLPSVPLNSEENQRREDDRDGGQSKNARQRSPAWGQQGALMMAYSLDHCQGLGDMSESRILNLMLCLVFWTESHHTA